MLPLASSGGKEPGLIECPGLCLQRFTHVYGKWFNVYNQPGVLETAFLPYWHWARWFGMVLVFFFLSIYLLAWSFFKIRIFPDMMTQNKHLFLLFAFFLRVQAI
jgi:hypothetical protein